MNAGPGMPAPALREDLRLAALLGLAAALATVALFPYLLQLMPDLRAKVRIALPLLILLQAMQAGLLLTLLSLIGLRIGHRAGLGAPWLRALLAGKPLPELPWALSILAGIGAAFAVLGLSLLTDPYLPMRLQAPAVTAAGATALNGFLASFYGGIAEEIQLRLFLTTLIVWLFARLSNKRPAVTVYWIAIIVAALLFGAGHLPAAAHVWPLDALVVARTILLNAVAGIVFGWLYWKRGLEMAMLAHFSADLILHVVAPVISGANP